ncbi:hypothetical protein AXG93_1028s1210 [Marchantia polymorpha subsp. ruderalis]|uniref:Uncharacterized protein n=1 Tax=Marchantia polymorpha subsp. ruderalis TaxID=1480154 RepID=A0A176W8N5_MARPO|nr:hypothetical protein AXG93_1028s1210 [Marchantia polymorpha subsp. ruderalis]
MSLAPKALPPKAHLPAGYTPEVQSPHAPCSKLVDPKALAPKGQIAARSTPEGLVPKALDPKADLPPAPSPSYVVSGVNPAFEHMVLDPAIIKPKGCTQGATRVILPSSQYSNPSQAKRWCAKVVEGHDPSRFEYVEATQITMDSPSTVFRMSFLSVKLD